MFTCNEPERESALVLSIDQIRLTKRMETDHRLRKQEQRQRLREAWQRRDQIMAEAERYG